ncbi:ShlB/FhaC/HecB family hemolysin secretion/activation protein [Selenomonas ruminantium]|uniref:Hemolysin activation/secretion protein n=1 Tax=Selenomonas ruminantium TaxID=971 RepID=A0A1K1N8J9_SELRU|nr:ShlB/FhaC/HecB family hemolysin secretion/activation protein [Selenomonas ruminantium]SFW31655.1 Hemolysin activation/secretion protein [Selenomonas ruminantium]
MRTLCSLNKVRIAAGMTLAVMQMGGLAYAAPSLSQPGQEVEKELPKPQAEVQDNTPAKPQAAPQVEFTITNFRLEAPDLYLDKGELVKILQDGMGEKKTMVQLNATLSELTRYCRQHGYPAAAAYVPAQESSDGMITIKVIPGRYGEIKIDNRSRLKESVAKGFVNGLKSGEIIRTGKLETTLYSISDVSGTKAVGVLSPGKEFGTSDLTVRIEKGKGSNTVLYVENYGSEDTGRYRYGLQHNIYDVSGNGDKVSVGVLLSNKKMHNYYANYETIIGHGGTTLGLGFSRMDYVTGIGNQGMEGIAETISLYGHRPLYHLTRSGLTVTYGYNYRRLTDEMKGFNFKTEKHSHSVYVGLEGFERRKGAIFNYQGKVTVGTLGLDSDWARRLYKNKKGTYAKGEANVTAVQRLGNSADVLMKLSGQIASHNLDGSERIYLGGANGVRAYPQGEGSGDEGIMATIEPRFYTKIPGLVFSTYFDIGHVKYNHDGSLDGRKTPSSGMTLKGYGFGLSYTKPNDWFARLDYARRIGGDPNLSEKAKANGRVWFMLGKIW